MIRRLLWLILSIIVAIILFILLIAFFPSRKKTVNVVNMRYVFVDSDGNEYDLFEKWHWAAQDRSFLLKDYVWDSDENQNNETEYNKTWHNLNSDNPFNLPEWAIEKPLPKDCETPRWIKLKDKESILAYQQREDVPDICNVQKRTCNDWILDGSYDQPACNEKIVYTYNSSNNTNKEINNTISYTKKKVVSLNHASENELIQTPKYTKNEGAKFDKNWKIIKWNEPPKTNWDPNDPEWEAWDYNSLEQKNKANFNCVSPRWEVIQHGQFVRAYELPFWFTNASCNVELRLCVDWDLKWSYTFQDCQYLDVTYEEYHNISSVQDEEIINLNHNITDKEQKWFWWWLKNLFN